MRKNLSIKFKINFSIVIVLLVGFILIGIATISKVKSSVKKEIAKQLSVQVNSISDFIQDIDESNKDLEKDLIKDAIADFRTKIILINNAQRSLIHAYDLADLEDEDIIKRLLRIVRNTKFKNRNTFVFTVSDNGVILEHPDQSLIGKKLDKDYIKKILKMKKGYFEYMDNGVKRYAFFRHNVDFEWVTVLTTTQDIILKNAVRLNKELIAKIKYSLKQLKIGDTGYYYVMDSKGVLIVHPKLEGKNISKFPFIREMMNKKNGITEYDWNGRRKIVAYTYYKDRDWIIAGGSYLNEFVAPALKAITIRFVIISLIVIILGIITLSLIFKKNLIQPLNSLENLLRKLASGDLTGKIDDYKNDEVGRIISDTNNMVDQMNKALSKVNHSTLQVNESAVSLANLNDEMAKGVESQAEQVTQVEVAVHEMTTTIREISENVENITSEVNQIKDAAATGGEVLGETVTSIQNLSDAVNHTASSIKELGSSSEQIGEILQVISEIADQTNLLALNAAIEAARAGEHGRGFAVVADEVRKLAERTVNATSEIDTMIGNIQKEVRNSVAQMNKGVELAEEGGMMVGNLRMSLEEIINGVMDIADKINMVAAAVEEQSATSQEISNNMTDISAVSQESASIATENREQAKTLIALADELANIVKQFKLREENN